EQRLERRQLAQQYPRHRRADATVEVDAEIDRIAHRLAHRRDLGHRCIDRARTVDQFELLGAVELEGIEAERAVSRHLLDDVGGTVAADPAIGLHAIAYAATQ